MAELHVLGSIACGYDFDSPSLFCKWKLESGANFRLLEGAGAGQTPCDTPNVSEPLAYAFTRSLARPV